MLLRLLLSVVRRHLTLVLVAGGLGFAMLAAALIDSASEPDPAPATASPTSIEVDEAERAQRSEAARQSAAVDRPEVEPEPSPSPSRRLSWERIFAFEGTTTKVSRRFRVPARAEEWRVCWDFRASADPYDHAFVVLLLDEDGDVIDEIVSYLGRRTSDCTFVYQPEGSRYALDVDTSGGSWSLRVEARV